MVNRPCALVMLWVSCCSAVSAASIQYGYDTLSRLTRATYADGTVVTYSYDAAGNRLTQVISNPSVALPAIGVDKTTLTFSAPAGQASSAQVIAVQNRGAGSLQWNASASVPWINVTPGSGTNSGAISVFASAAGLAPGNYTGSLMILASASNGPMNIPVIFTVTSSQGNPTITSGGITSAAGFRPGVTRGSVASIFGTSLASGTALAQSVPLPRSLSSVQVTVDGVVAPLWYVDSNQINFQIPFEAPLQGPASIVVMRDGVSSAPSTVELVPYAPSVFIYQRSDGAFDPIIVHSSTNQLVTPTNPAVAGEFIVVYGTGLGDLTVLPSTGELSPSIPTARAKVMPSVIIGGVSAQQVTYAGLTPGAIGLAQFNIQLPNTLTSANKVPLSIRFSDSATSTVDLWVKSQSTPGSFTVGTFAGTGVNGFSGDGGNANAAQLSGPQGLATDAQGNVFIADYGNARIRKIRPDGSISTVAGTGVAGYSGDGGPAVNARLNSVYGVAVDTRGNLYIADGNNRRVRKVGTDGTIATVAGTGVGLHSGDGGPATVADVGPVTGITVDSAGNLYLSSPSSARVRKVSLDGTISTLAGNGIPGSSGDGGLAVNASLNSPEGVAVDGVGNVYIADASNARIRKVTPDGIITTVAGGMGIGFSGDGGPATAAGLTFPADVAVDAAGNLYIADTQSHRIRVVGADGVIRTIAGTGRTGFSGDGGPATSADLNFPYGIAVDGQGNVYIGDTVNQRVRKLTK